MRSALTYFLGGSLALAAAVAPLPGCSQRSDAATAKATAGGELQGAGFRVVDVAPQPGHKLGELLNAEAAKARSLGFHPFVEISAVWCGPCQRLKQSLGDPLMVNALAGTYLIRLDLDQWQQGLDEAGLHTEGVPIFFKLSDDGRPTGARIAGDAWSQDDPAHMAPALRKFFNG